MKQTNKQKERNRIYPDLNFLLPIAFGLCEMQLLKSGKADAVKLLTVIYKVLGVNFLI